MVNPSILLGASLAGVASALYLPHEGEDSIFAIPADTPADVASNKVQASIFGQLQDKPRKKARGHGCGKKSKKHHGDKAAKHLSKHHSKNGGLNEDGEEPSRWAHHKGHHKGHHKSNHKGNHKGSHKDHHKGVKAENEFKAAPVSRSGLLNVDGVFTQSDPERVISDSYIVILKDGTKLEDALARLAPFSANLRMQKLENGETHPLLEEQHPEGFDITHIYNSSFLGYAGKLLPEAAQWLAAQPEVAVVERDSKVHALKAKEEDQAPWGLARVSHRDPLGLGTYNKYLYDAHAGEGVTSYIVDTGIYIDHEDFEGRARWGKTMPAGDSDVDAHGHGSHCAGTIGGSRYGVAKKAQLVAVKVLGSDGSGSMSDVIGGVEFVVESHRKEQKEKGSKLKGSTANMSLGGGKSPALDIAVNAATEAGVHFAVAAGNENQDACQTSPAGATGPVTVGATDVRDDRAYFSNYGKCVDIFAPGVGVLSVGTSSPSSTAVMSGTSMASPHIAGLLTYFVSLQPSTDSQYSTRGSLSTKELKKYLIKYGTSGVISDLDAESPNVLAYNGGGEDISDFWTGSEKHRDDEDDSPKHGSFLDRVGDLIEDVVDDIEDSLENLF